MNTAIPMPPEPDSVTPENQEKEPKKSIFPPPVLKLDEDGERELNLYVMEQLRECAASLGRDYQGGTVRSSKFFKDIEIYIDQWKDDMAWRQNMFPGSVFSRLDNAVSYNPVRQNHIVKSAQLEKDHFGAPGDTWFSAEPKRAGAAGKGARSPEFAEDLNRYFKCKVDGSNARKTLKEAIAPAMAIGYQPIKVSHFRDETKYRDRRLVLIDSTTDKPIIINGNYVTPEDWIDPEMAEPSEEELAEQEEVKGSSVFGKIAEMAGKAKNMLMGGGAEAPAPVAPQEMPMEGAPVGPEYTGRVCRWDEDFQEPAGLTEKNYRMEEIDVTDVIYDGPRADSIYWKDFLFMKDTPSLQRGTIGHLFEMSEQEIEDRFQGEGTAKDAMKSALSQLDASKKTAFRIDEVGNDLTQADTSKFQKKSGLVCEVYTEYFLKGVKTQIWGLMLVHPSLQTGIWIYRDYTAVHLKKGIRPISFIVPNPIQGLARGESMYKLNFNKQICIMLLFAREFLKNSQNGKVRIVNKYLLEESNQNFIVGDGTVLERREGSDVSAKIFEEFQLYDEMDGDVALRGSLEAQLAIENGVMNEAAGAQANVPSSELATGIKSNQEIASIIVAKESDAIAQGETEVMEAFLRITVQHMPDDEEYEFSEGDTPQVGKVYRHQLSCLDYAITLSVTNRRQLKIYERDDEAMAVVEKFWAFVQQSVALFQLGVDIETAIRGHRLFCIQQLRSIGVSDPENVIPDCGKEIAAKLTQQAQMQAQIQAQAAEQGVPIDPSTGQPSTEPTPTIAETAPEEPTL